MGIYNNDIRKPQQDMLALLKPTSYKYLSVLVVVIYLKNLDYGHKKSPEHALSLLIFVKSVLESRFFSSSYY